MTNGPQVDRIVWSDAIDFLFGEIAFLSELRWRMPCAADDPFTGLLLGGECLDRVERISDALSPTHIHHVFRQTGGLEMRVGIDQPGNRSLAAQIENTRPRADEGFDGGVAS